MTGRTVYTAYNNKKYSHLHSIDFPWDRLKKRKTGALRLKKSTAQSFLI